MNHHADPQIDQQLSTERVGAKGEIFRLLTQNLPINNYHLPEFIYRADMIPENIMGGSASGISPEDRRIILEGAELPITFYHGYPAINETQPLWERLNYEPSEAYDSYLLYLELPEKSQHANPIRLLPHIAALTGHHISIVTEWCHIYYWHFRARAYDLFLAAAHRKQREQRIMSIEGKHFQYAEIALDKINGLLNSKLDKEIMEFAEDPMAETESKAKDLVSMAKELIAIQRISVGLPANGVEKLDITERGPRNAQSQEIYRHIAKEGAGEEQPQQRSAEMDHLLQNPEDLASIQQLLIRAQRPTYVPPSWGDGTIIDVESEPYDEQPPTTNAQDGGEMRQTTAEGGTDA